QLIFSTSNDRVLTVDENGLVTAVNAGQAEITVTNHNGTVSVKMNVIVYPKDSFTLEFSEGFNGFIKVNDEFTINVLPFGQNAELRTFTFEVEDDQILELTDENNFKALQAGLTHIEIFEGEELIFTYTVHIQEALNPAERVDALLSLLASANTNVVSGLNVMTYYTASQEWSDPRYESVNAFLCDELVIDRTSFPADPTKFSNTLKPSTEFILVHDTANLNGGLMTHGAFFANPANQVGIHYTVGDYGVLGSLPDAYVGWHAGDGSSYTFTWQPTGIQANGNYNPVIDISVDGFFTFNGIKSSIQAPRGNSNQILDKSYFTMQGPVWDIQGGQYVMAPHYFDTSQQTRGVIGARAGNKVSTGIEMNINKNADIVDTVQRTAKLVAWLLDYNDLELNRVIQHNTITGKGDPYTLNNTVWNGTWYWERFMQHVAIELEVLQEYSDATIEFSSNSPLVSNTGRVVVFPEETTEVEYTITVT